MNEKPIEEKKQYYCSECGIELNDNAAFCPNCGADLSATIEGDPEEPVSLRIFPDSKDADLTIAQLAAIHINAVKALTPWSEDVQATEVLVRRADLKKAEEALALISRKPKTMFLADIFSNTFTIAGKTFKKNIVIASLFIPAGLIFVFCMHFFFSGLYVPDIDKNKAYVYTEEAKERDITQSLHTSGTIDINKKVVTQLTDFDLKQVTVNDVVWISLNDEGQSRYRGNVSKIGPQINIDESGNSDTLTSVDVFIEITEPDHQIKTGQSCDIEIEQETHSNTISVTSKCLYTQSDSSADENSGSKEYVYIVEDGKAKAVEVLSGFSDNGFTEILSGLSVGDEVIHDYSNSGKELSNGVEISTKNPDEGVDLKNVALSIFVFIIGIIVIVLVNTAVTIGVTKSASGVMEEEDFSISNIFSTIFSLTGLRAFTILIVTMIVAVAPFIAVIFIVSFTKSLNNGSISGLSAILFLPAIIFGIYIYIRWYFSFMHTIITGDGILLSLKKSSFLTKHTWWRTFGILMLVSLVVNFIVSLISTPFSFIFMWDYISSTMNNAASGNIEQNSQDSLKILKSMGWGFSFSMILSYLLQCLIAPVFAVVMYYDLRIRKNDFFMKIKEQTITNPEPQTGQPE